MADKSPQIFIIQSTDAVSHITLDPSPSVAVTTPDRRRLARRDHLECSSTDLPETRSRSGNHRATWLPHRRASINLLHRTWALLQTSPPLIPLQNHSQRTLQNLPDTRRSKNPVKLSLSASYPDPLKLWLLKTFCKPLQSLSWTFKTCRSGSKSWLALKQYLL